MMVKKSASPETQSVDHVALVGRYPPPIGGVSVHIKRLKKELDSLGVNCTVYDLGASQYKSTGVVPVKTRAWLLNCLLSSSSEQIIHDHGTTWKQRAIISLLFKPRSARTVYTFQSLRDEMENLDPLTRLCVKLVMRLGDHLIAVSSDIRNKLISWGASSDKITVIPGFIPPQIEPDDFDTIPDYIWQFMNKHSPIITANAYRISFFRGEDLYGIDMCVELCTGLRREFPNVGFVFCLPDIGDEKYFQELKSQLVAEGLSNDFLFVNEQIEYYPILANADLFVRPTNTDGDAISVREAIWLGTPAVCSDAVVRPDGVVLFRNRNTRDLLEKSVQALQNRKALGKVRETPPDGESSQAVNAMAIYEIYKKLLEIGHISSGKLD